MDNIEKYKKELESKIDSDKVLYKKQMRALSLITGEYREDMENDKDYYDGTTEVVNIQNAVDRLKDLANNIKNNQEMLDQMNKVSLDY